MADPIEILLQGINDTGAAFTQAQAAVNTLAATMQAADLNITPVFDQASLDQARAAVEQYVAALSEAEFAPGISLDPAEIAQVKAELEAQLAAAQVQLDLDNRSAAARIAEINTQLAALQAKAAAGTLTIGEAGQIRTLTGEMRGLENVLGGTKVATGEVNAGMGALNAIIPGIGSKIATAFSVAGVVMFAKEVASAVWSLNQMREESAQIEARFIAFGGGAAKATEALHAMDAAIGGAMTRDEKMAAVARITSLELTKSAQGTAELARQALLLGDASASAESKIDSLTQILVTGRTIGLAQYGISAAAVNERVKELQAETSTLSDLEAKQIAIMEALATKADAVAAAGGRAATATKELANAWDDLKDTTADKINLDVGVSGLAEVLRAIEGGMQRGVQFNPFGNVAGQIITLIDAERQYNAMMVRANSATGDFADRLANAASATPPVAAGVDAISEALAGLRKSKDATDVNTVAMALFKGEITQAQIAALSLADALALVQGQQAMAAGDWIGPTRLEADTAAGQRKLAAIKEQEDAAKDLQTANERAAKATQAAWDKAFDAIANSAKSEFGKAQDQLKGLLPDMNLGGENKPGSNGPFENIFRAADVAAHGAASPWAAKLGLTQEEAKKIVSDFAQGFRTPEVRKLIDEAMLVDQTKQAQAAADSLTAWGNEIAAKAGVSTALAAGNKAVANAIFGGTTKAAGKDSAGVQTTSYDAAAKAMLDGFAASAQTQVSDATFGKDMAKIGRQTFTLFEGGALEAAQESQAMKAWIYAMVLAAATQQKAGQAVGLN